MNPTLHERVRALEEREKGFTTLMGERFDRQDEILQEIRQSLRGELDSIKPKVAKLDRAYAWALGAWAAATVIFGVAAWLVSVIR